MKNNGTIKSKYYRIAICPHDDYSYAALHYIELLKDIKASTVIIFGVAHKAKGVVENRIVFEQFDYWKEPYGNMKISGLRNQIIKKLPGKMFIIHDSLQQVEHSIEAMIPFLQYYNREVEIIPILVWI